MKARILTLAFRMLAFLATSSPTARAAEWQWSAAEGNTRAYLWIPQDCRRVRAVVVANHNMIEQGILEHTTMRRTLSELGIAEVWVVPMLDPAFDFNKGAGDHFNRIMKILADDSGYAELELAPVIPLGHSACASFPWNFAAWNPSRTLAILSVHGDAPQTNLTGYGRAKVDWGDRNIDGVPGLMVMGEYEWGEPRLAPALEFMAKHPKAPIALLADAGHGHFDFSDQLVSFLAMFIRKAAAERLPADEADIAFDRTVTLNPVDPARGWRTDRWRKDQLPTSPSAPFYQYAGDSKEAFWCFDKEMADTTEACYTRARGKRPQLIAVYDTGDPAQGGCGEPVAPRFLPEADGISFHLTTRFADSVPGDEKNRNPARWAVLSAGTPLGHATGGGPIVLSKIVGPVIQSSPDTFMVSLDRAIYTPNRRNNDLWLLASHPGDDQFKSIVQQVMVHISPNKAGTPQHIVFPEIANQKVGVASIELRATSDAHLPVHYYVREGPVEVDGDKLVFSPIPPRSKLPLQITIIAWQWGTSSEPKIQTATSVERTFLMQP